MIRTLGFRAVRATARGRGKHLATVACKPPHSSTARCFSSSHQVGAAQGNRTGARGGEGGRGKASEHKSAYVEAASKAKRLARGQTLVAEARAMAAKGLCMEDRFFTQAIQAFGRAGEWRRALDVIALMEEELGVSADAVKFNSCIQACGRAGEWQRALGLVHEMEQRGLVLPNLQTYTLHLQVMTKTNQLESAVTVLKTVARYGVLPDCWCFTVVLEECEREGRVDLQWEVTSEIERNAVEPDQRLGELMLRVYKRKGSWGQALLLARKLYQQFGGRFDVLRAPDNMDRA